jgi:two-component system phosphate regulon response regulator PhoB
LIIARDHEVLDRVSAAMRGQGFRVATVGGAEEGFSRAAEMRPDLIIVDLQLFGSGIIEICRRLRGRHGTNRATIFLIATQEREVEILTSLQNGADDYFLKPLVPEKLLARCRIAFRRRSEGLENVVEVRELTIDPNAFEAHLAGKRLELTPTEFRLLYLLACRPGWAFTRYQIVDAIRGEDYLVQDRAVDGQVLGLRKKLGEYGDYVETIRGVGYRFRPAPPE